MFARKKVGPRPLPLRDLDAPRALTPVAAASVAGPAALVLAAISLLACASSQAGPGVVEVVGTTAPTECPRLGGAPPVPANYTSPTTTTATPSATPSATTPSATPAGHIQPIVDPPPLGGEPPSIR